MVVQVNPLLYLLSDKEISFIVLKEFVEFKYIRVVHLLENTDLREQLLFLFFFKVLLVDNLHCSKSISLFVETLSHFAIRS